MEKFVAREHELIELNQMYQSSNFEMAVIYGRRRVGKTALIRKFIQDKPAVYSQGIETTSNLNLVYLSQAIFHFEDPDHDDDYQVFTDYRKAFERIQSIADRLEQKLVFVLDEYPYYASSNRSISSILQFMIDHIYKEHHNIMLILCGSSMSFMEKQVMGYKSPLYGRRTGQFKLMPFNIFDTKKMLPKVNDEDLMAYYGVTGGIPQYLEGVNEDNSVEQNIENMFLHERSLLRYEPNVLLQQELRNPTMYFAILTAIANGKSKYNDIFQAVNLKSSNALSPYLNNLIDLGIIEQKKPILEPNSRKSIYSFRDGLFRFWFKFIAGAQDQIALGVINGLKKYIFSELPRFLRPTFEQASADWVWHNAKRLPIEPRIVSHWWGNNPKRKREEEVDLVAPDFGNQEAIIGECKWRSQDKLKPEMIDLLAERAMLIPKLKKHDLYFFVKESNATFDKYAKSKGVAVVKYQNFFK